MIKKYQPAPTSLLVGDTDPLKFKKSLSPSRYTTSKFSSFDLILSIEFKNKCLWSIFECALFQDKSGNILQMVCNLCNRPLFDILLQRLQVFNCTISAECFSFTKKLEMPVDITSKFQKMLYYYPCCVSV